MIAVAVLGILAAIAIAIPSYTQHVENSAIADARASLMGLANAMERQRAQNGSYLGAATDGDNSGPPRIYHVKSPESGTAFFNLTITISDATPSSYELTATATANAPGIAENLTIALVQLSVDTHTVRTERSGSAVLPSLDSTQDQWGVRILELSCTSTPSFRT